MCSLSVGIFTRSPMATSTQNWEREREKSSLKVFEPLAVGKRVAVKTYGIPADITASSATSIHLSIERSSRGMQIYLKICVLNNKRWKTCWWLARAYTPLQSMSIEIFTKANYSKVTSFARLTLTWTKRNETTWNETVTVYRQTSYAPPPSPFLSKWICITHNLHYPLLLSSLLSSFLVFEARVRFVCSSALRARHVKYWNSSRKCITRC